MKLEKLTCFFFLVPQITVTKQSWTLTSWALIWENNYLKADYFKTKVLYLHNLKSAAFLKADISHQLDAFVPRQLVLSLHLVANAFTFKHVDAFSCSALGLVF